MPDSSANYDGPDVNRAFYESDPRSSVIRKKTLLCIGAYKELLASKVSAAEKLLASCQELGRLGVTARMHVIEENDPLAGEKLRRIQGDPVAATEWIAGQLLAHLEGRSFNSLDSSGYVIREHDELSDITHGEIIAFDPQASNRSMASDAVAIALPGMLEYMLAGEEGID